MTLSIPPLPPILVGCRVDMYEKWFAFWSLPLEKKADLVDEYPDLIIEQPTPAVTSGSGGPKVKVFFDPQVLDVKIPSSVIYHMWDKIIRHGGFYPTQHWHTLKQPFNTMTEEHQKRYLSSALNVMNFAMAAYKYRYSVRPEDYYFVMDYEDALFGKYSVTELLTFYDPQR